jgi:hypothetical protein
MPVTFYQSQGRFDQHEHADTHVEPAITLEIGLSAVVWVLLRSTVSPCPNRRIPRMVAVTSGLMRC